jgi:hypothetical protein
VDRPQSAVHRPGAGLALAPRRAYRPGMTEEQPAAERTAQPGSIVGRSIDDFVQQLRGFTDRARTAAGSMPARLSLPSPPGAMSAAQLRAVADMVAAQRASMAAMRAQLDAFDQQLAVFERVLEPLVEWSGSWARLEEAVGDFVRRDGGGSGGSGSAGAGSGEPGPAGADRPG